MHRGNPQCSGRSNNAEQILGTIDFQLLISGPSTQIGLTEPVIGIDSTIYIGSSYDSDSLRTGGFLYAISPYGETKWKLYIGENWITTTPIVDKDNFVFCCSFDGHLIKVTPDGEVFWDYDIGEIVQYGGMNIDQVGNIYLIAEDQHLYSVSKDGMLNWQIGYDGGFNSTPDAGLSFSPDGETMYVPSSDYLGSKALYAISKDGTLKWSFDNSGSVIGTPMVDFQGIIYVNSLSLKDSLNGFIALYPDGTIKDIYKYSSENYPIDGSIDKMGNLYIQGDVISNPGLETEIISLTYNFELRWKLLFEGLVLTPISLDGMNNLYFFTKSLYSITNLGQTRWHLDQLADGFNGLAIGNGFIIFNSVNPIKIISKIH
ncbi:MAG: hypothetical protein Kow0098_00010 [Ignavibacteriaceae bacterium]